MQIFGAEWESDQQAYGDINLRLHPDKGDPVTAASVYSGSQTGEHLLPACPRTLRFVPRLSTHLFCSVSSSSSPDENSNHLNAYVS